MAAAVPPGWLRRRSSSSKDYGRTNASAATRNADSMRSVRRRPSHASRLRVRHGGSSIRCSESGEAVKYIRYTKYKSEPGGGVDLQELVKRLSDFFLQSGFESQFYGISEMDPEKSMEALRQAIQRALEEGDLMPDQQLQDLLDGTPEQQSAKMKELIDQLMDQLMQEGYVTGQPQVTGPPEKMPRGQVGQGRDRETEARFEITDKTIDFLGFKTLKDLMASLGKSSFGRHDTRDLSTGVESGGISRPYEFGDTLNLDISATLFNAVRRDGARVPIELDYPD